MVIDSREKAPLPFIRGPNVEAIETAALPVGDYSIKGFEDKIAIERKSCSDLFGTLGKDHDRFKKELERAKDYDYFAILVEGSYSDVLTKNFPNSFRTQMRGWTIIDILYTLKFKYGFDVIFAKDRTEATSIVRQTLKTYYRLHQQIEV